MSEIDDIYGAVRRLEAKYPGRSFTPDGIMVGSIGEVRAAEIYDITLLPPNTPDYDALDPEGRRIQIRTNQGQTTPLQKEYDYLIAQKLHPDGSIEEVYNGPGGPAWSKHTEVKADAHGFHHIRHNKLRKLMTDIPETERIKKRSTEPAGRAYVSPAAGDPSAHP